MGGPGTPPAGGGAGRGLARTEERGGAGRVQATNDEAALSKASAVRAGYFADPHLGAFVPEAPARAALVNRCYHARVSAVRAVLRGFLAEAGDGEGSGPPQVVSLGAGFGTDGFLALREAWGGRAGLRWVDCDFLALARRKAAAIRASPELRTLLRLPEGAEGGGEEAEAETGALPRVLGSEAGYCLVGLDLRDLNAAEVALRDHGGVDFGRRTLILTECVLNYLTQRQGERVLAWAVRRFARAVFVSYDQMLLRDAFGRAMAGCLRNRGSPLRGLDGGLPGDDPPPAEAETEAGALAGLRARFERQGWSACGAVSMSEACRSFLPRVAAARFQEAHDLEAFDEFEEWDVQCAHYGLSWGLTPGAAADPAFARALDRFPLPPVDPGAPRAGPAAATGAPVAPALRLHDPPPEPPQKQKKAKRGAGRGGRRFGQASVGLPDGQVAIVGGFGCGCGPGRAQRRLGDVLLLDPFGTAPGGGAQAPGKEPSWREVPCSGAPLRPRMGHAMAALSTREGLTGRAALFGGREAPGAPLEDLCILELPSGGGAEWRDVTDAAAEASPEGCTPSARWRHSFTNAGLSGRSGADLVLLLGGWDGAAALGDAFVLQVGSGVSRDTCPVSWLEVTLVGQVPAARFGHTVTRLGSAPGPSGAPDHLGVWRFVLFGGRDGVRIFGDAFALTLVEPAKGDTHWLLRCDELPSLSPPPPRYAHAACFLPDANGSVLVVGGCTGAGDGPAAFILNCSSWEWQELRVAGQVAGARQGDVLWVRQGLHGAPRGRTVALVGGGGVCLGFGSHYNPLVLTGTL